MSDITRSPEVVFYWLPDNRATFVQLSWPYTLGNSPSLLYFFLYSIYLRLASLYFTCVPWLLSVSCTRMSALWGWEIFLFTAVPQHPRILPGTELVLNKHLLNQWMNECCCFSHHIHVQDWKERASATIASVLFYHVNKCFPRILHTDFLYILLAGIGSHGMLLFPIQRC